jgi:ER membrane protein complex subunit 2
MVPTMDLPSAFQRLANYRTKNTRLSRQIFESGLVVYRNNAWHKLGDDSKSPLSTYWQRPRLMITLGWQFLESLALAAADVGRIDVAEVSCHAPAFPSIWVFGVFIKRAWL